jgi:phosphoribosylformylglycinamidine synthase
VGGLFDIAAAGLRPDALLFSESASRMIVSTPAPGRVEEIARRHGVPVVRLGAVGGDRLQIAVDGRVAVDLTLSALHEAWLGLEHALA